MVEQLAAAGLVQSAFGHPAAQEVQLGLTHNALQAEEQSVVEVGGVVQAIVVAQQRAEQAAQANQGGPVRIRACQAACLQAQDDADVIEPEFGQEVLEARTSRGRLPTPPLIRVDDLNTVARPAE